eukprot:TRINITY_DN35272_c0_g1_i2.p1 TRINITY_DN35272_c0_g1~~TRINITY_DN35272_c0_g1_i2.p1  ORF type:complete len:383 (-),score=4.45 TRINITY_DN35272_c0_g1_i2:330-1478(-)
MCNQERIMAGETILISDSSAGVQEISRSILEDAGYRVVLASNHAAALTYPELENVELALLEKDSQDLDGLRATRLMRGNKRTFQTPVLLMLNREPREEDLPSAGNFNYLVKPFSAQQLLQRVKTLIDERGMLRESDAFLRKASEEFMEEMAEKQVKSALERKTGLLVERLIQEVTQRLDDHMNGILNTRYVTLTEVREEELVKKVVAEVADSQITQMAETKVQETAERALRDSSERAVKRIAEEVLPNLIRSRLKEIVEFTVPKDINRRLQQAMDSKAQEFSAQIVEMIQSLGQQMVPKIANERLPEMISRHLELACDQQLPRMIKGWVSYEIEDQVQRAVEPVIEAAAQSLKKKTLFIASVLFGLNFIAIATFVAFFLLKA